MRQGIHFISGLPRSGSTLLAAILRQNPRFHAGMTSPVGAMYQALEQSMSRRSDTAVFIGQQRHRLADGLPDCSHQRIKIGITGIQDALRRGVVQQGQQQMFYGQEFMALAARLLVGLADGDFELFTEHD